MQLAFLVVISKDLEWPWFDDGGRTTTKYLLGTYCKIFSTLAYPTSGLCLCAYEKSVQCGWTCKQFELVFWQLWQLSKTTAISVSGSIDGKEDLIFPLGCWTKCWVFAVSRSAIPADELVLQVSAVADGPARRAALRSSCSNVQVVAQVRQLVDTD